VSRSFILAISAFVAFGASATLFESPAAAEETARDGGDPVNTVTLDTMPLALDGELHLEYERALNDDFSLFAGPTVAFAPHVSCSCSLSGWGATAGARFFTDTAPRGLFFGVFGTVLYASATENGSPATVTGLEYEAGGMVGYTFIIARHFDLSLGAGLAYAHEQLALSYGGDSVTVGGNGVVPALRLALGAAF
jgi:hypothetical protein